ncbi:hypothetical protein KKI23_03275 [Patescibacteria group bacterium]|nr:hypothetical protein [Patescibacteria group bacterium]
MENQGEEKKNIKPEESEKVKIFKTALGSVLLNIPIIIIFGVVMIFFFWNGSNVNWSSQSNLLLFVILFNILSGFLLSRRRHKKSLKAFFAIFIISLLPYLVLILMIYTV